MKSGRIRFHQDFKKAGRYFFWNEVLEDLGLSVPTEEKIVIGYCRVSTRSQIDDLVSQKQLVENYCAAKGYNFRIIEDVGSGINYNKKGLRELISLIHEDKIKTIVIAYRDRLLRFGNEIIF